MAVPGPYEEYHVQAPQGFTRQRFLAEVHVSKGDRISVKRTDGIVSTGKYRPHPRSERVPLTRWAPGHASARAAAPRSHRRASRTHGSDLAECWTCSFSP